MGSAHEQLPLQGLLENPPPADNPHNIIVCGDDQDAVTDAKQLIDCQPGFKASHGPFLRTMHVIAHALRMRPSVTSMQDSVRVCGTLCQCFGDTCNCHSAKEKIHNDFGLQKAHADIEGKAVRPVKQASHLI